MNSTPRVLDDRCEVYRYCLYAQFARQLNALSAAVALAASLQGDSCPKPGPLQLPVIS